MKRERKIRLIVGGLLIVLLLIGILLILNISEAEGSTNKESIISGNTVTNKADLKHEIYKPARETNLVHGTSPEEYTLWEEHRKLKILGLHSYVYEVHVNNLKGGREYTTKHTAHDYFGNQRAHEANKYIFGHEDKIFRFRDISKDMAYYNTWKYKVLPRE